MTKNLRIIVLHDVEHQVTETEYSMLIGSCFPFYGPQPGDKAQVQNASQLEITVKRESTDTSDQDSLQVSRAWKYVPVPVGSSPSGRYSRNLKVMTRVIRDFCRVNSLETPSGLDKGGDRIRQVWSDLHRQYGPYLPRRRIYRLPNDDVEP